MTTTSKKIIATREGNVGIVELNNPRSLHALTHDMIESLHKLLTQWNSNADMADDSIHLWLMKSAEGTKVPAFCAGGDVKTVCQVGQASYKKNGTGECGVYTADVFRLEYSLNYILAHGPIPQISIWDGIVMGGGVGLSIYGMYRVATENTVFAMPETAIGLFPDIGATYWMPRLMKVGVAVYLALTGQKLHVGDLVDTGIATHYIPSKKLHDLEVALVDLSTTVSSANIIREIDALLATFHEEVSTVASPRLLSTHSAIIDDIFDMGVLNKDSKRTVEDIMASLDRSSMMGNQFAADTLTTMRRMSPTSLKVTLEGMRRGNSCSTLGEDLRMEYRMVQAFMRRDMLGRPTDFYEGVRAVLIDKDYQPKWLPPTLADVSVQMVESYFQPLEPQYEWQIPDIFEPQAKQ
jgi:enoyl-CoA hydratase/carnithine racemase